MPPSEYWTRPAPEARQIDIYRDARMYSAFPHMVRLGGDELVIAFRQAPRTKEKHHAHPASVIVVMRSYDLGRTWQRDWATQVAAGGGQELGLIHLGGPRVGGVLAWQEVVHPDEMARAGVPRHFPREYPFSTPGSYWIWSETYGLTWRPDHIVFMGSGTMPCAAPIRLHNGSLLCPVYRWEGQNDAMSSVFYASQDDGKTWSGATTIAEASAKTGGLGEPCVVELEPGHLRAMHRAEGQAATGHFWTNESFDGGHTWTEPVKTDILSGACPRVIKLADGRLLLTFGRRREPFGIRAMLSSDGGRTWGDTAWILRRGRNGDLGYTSSLQLAPDEILTTTYAHGSRGITGIVGTFWRLPQQGTRR